MLQRAKFKVNAPATTLRDNIRQLIRERFHGAAQGAYFRKLETTCSDQDLVSLLEDLHVIDGFAQEDFDVANKAK